MAQQISWPTGCVCMVRRIKEQQESGRWVEVREEEEATRQLARTGGVFLRADSASGVQVGQPMQIDRWHGEVVSVSKPERHTIDESCEEWPMHREVEALLCFVKLSPLSYE